MKLKDGFFLNAMGDEFVVIAVSNNAKKIFGGMLRLNPTGAFLYRQLETEKTREQLAAALAQEYSLDPAAAAAECGEFVNTLVEVGLLDE